MRNSICLRPNAVFKEVKPVDKFTLVASSLTGLETTTGVRKFVEVTLEPASNSKKRLFLEDDIHAKHLLGLR